MRWRRWSAVGMAVVVAVGGGFWLVTRDNLAERRADVSGSVLWSADESQVSIGPGGWFAYSGDDGAQRVQHAPTGRGWTIDSVMSLPTLTSDGTAISPLGGGVLVATEQNRWEATGDDLVVAHGDRTLVPGADLNVVGLSVAHVAVETCLAPTEGRLGEQVSGGTVVLAGVRLADATVTWTYDTGADCATDVAALYPDTLTEQRYLLLHPTTEATTAVDLDSGQPAARWQDAPVGRVVVQDERVLYRAGDTVTVSTLPDRGEVASVTCAGARIANPGDRGGRLSGLGTLMVECGDSARLFDGTRFVTVDAAPVGSDQLVPADRAVAFDRLLLTRQGDLLTVRDVLQDREVGTFDVPADFRLATNEPRGRLLAFYQSGEERFRDAVTSAFRVIDVQTGAVVLSTRRALSPGIDLTPDGYATVDARQSVRRPRGRTYVVHHAWVVGIRG